jgi:hypothetical protein
MAKDYSEDQLIQRSTAEPRDRLLLKVMEGEINT